LEKIVEENCYNKINFEKAVNHLIKQNLIVLSELNDKQLKYCFTDKFFSILSKIPSNLKIERKQTLIGVGRYKEELIFKY
jgi:hypothetical protein